MRYFDHHAAGRCRYVRTYAAHIDEASDLCTSLLVDRQLGGAHRAWALVGIYGDNLGAVADRLALDGGFEPGDCAGLRRLGVLISFYNAYGEFEATCASRRLLLALMARYSDPRDMLVHERVDEIDAMRHSDLRLGADAAVLWQGHRAACACCLMRRGIGACRAVLPTSWQRARLCACGAEGAGRRLCRQRACAVALPRGAHALCSRFNWRRPLARRASTVAAR
jgi:hypothetical protein